MKAIYIRVSTQEQNTDRQKVDLNAKVYEDKISGSVPFSERPQARKLISDIEANRIKEVEVSSLSRLGRKMSDLILLLDFFDLKEVNLIVRDLGISSRIAGKKNKIFNLIGLMLANFAEMQRDEILESQSQAIKIKKQKGLRYHDSEREKENEEEFLFKYKNIIKDLNKGISDAHILKTNYIIHDKNYLNLTDKERKSYRGKMISRNTLKKIKRLIA